MSIRFIYLLVAASLIFQSTQTAAQLTNAKVKRIIDLSSSIAISKTTVTLENTGPDPVSHFYLPIHSTEISKIADVWVVAHKSPKKGLKLETVSSLENLDSSHGAYKVELPQPLASGSQIVLDIRIDLTDSVVPVPATMEKFDTQYMRFTGNAFFFSLYPTKSIQTTLVLGSSSVTSNTLREPFKKDSEDPKRYILGPYTDVDSKSYDKISIRFKNDNGFLVAKKMTKQFFVSHWGSIATKEEYKLTNAGAKFQGAWSRADYDAYSSKYKTAIGDMWANLPPDATRVVYKDLVGNITSSRLRKPAKSKRPVQLTFRFPLMGGWMTYLWFTYDINLKNYLTSGAHHKHRLELPLFPSANVDLFCEELTVQVLLPEGAQAYKILDHPSLSFEVEHSLERTSLTLYGRPVITLKLRGIRSMSKHTSKFTVVYRYNQSLIWVTPLIIAAVVFAALATFIVCLRSGLSMADDGVVLDKLKSS